MMQGTDGGRARGRRDLLAALAVALLAAGGAAAGPAQRQLDAQLAGKVTDPEGRPIAGVRVVIEDLERGDRVEVTTDEGGDYFRRGLRRAPYRIRYEREGYEAVQLELLLRRGLNTVDVTMGPLQRAPAVDLAALGETYEEGYEAFRQRRFGEAVAAMEVVVAGIEDPEDARDALLAALTILGRSHLELGQLAEAVATYERLLELEPGRVEARLDLGQAYSQQGRYELAAGQFRQAVALAPEDALAHYNLGVVLLQEGQLEEGVAALEEAVRLRPHYPVAHKSLGFAYARLGEYRRAAEELELYLAQEPAAPDADEIRQFVEALRQQTGPGGGSSAAS